MNSKAYESLLVILPTLNEALSITETVLSIRHFAPGCEILMVDNGSTDDTVQIAIELGLQVVHEPNLGKGFAIRRGFSYANHKHKAVFMVDADDTYSVDEVVEA